MKKFFILMMLLSIAFTNQLVAQEQTKLELPEYTTEQLWGRCGFLQVATMVAGISHAKSMGKTAEEYGEFFAKTFSPGWGKPGSGSTKIIRGVRRNYLSLKGTTVEVLKYSESLVTARVNRRWVGYFGENKTRYGVTLDEYETCFKVFNKRLAEYLGLEYKEEIKDDMLYITFTKKK